jgi:dihydrofolate reductase
MAGDWSTASGAIADFMNRVPEVVFSRTVDAAGWSNSRLVRGEAADEIGALKRGAGKDLFAFGSAKLCDSLMRRGLFDEYRICIAPVVLRNGAPLRQR